MGRVGAPPRAVAAGPVTQLAQQAASPSTPGPYPPLRPVQPGVQPEQRAYRHRGPHTGGMPAAVASSGVRGSQGLGLPVLPFGRFVSCMAGVGLPPGMEEVGWRAKNNACMRGAMQADITANANLL